MNLQNPAGISQTYKLKLNIYDSVNGAPYASQESEKFYIINPVKPGTSPSGNSPGGA